jgi:hypothetical protein
MPEIIVTADRENDRGEGAVMLRERINLSDFESATFAQRLVERLGWAVGDAAAVEQQQTTPVEQQQTTLGEQHTAGERPRLGVGEQPRR